MNDKTPVTGDPGVAVVGSHQSDDVAVGPAADEESHGNGGDGAGEMAAGMHRPSERWRRPPSSLTGARQRAQPSWLVPVLLVVTVLSIAAAIGFGVAWSGSQSQQNTQATVKRVAGDFLVALTNFKPNTLDSDFRTIATYATGDFAKQSNQFFGSSIRAALETAQASSEGQLRYVEVQSLRGNQASVYAWVDQTAVNNKVSKPFTDTLQVVLDLTDTSSGWKISDVTVLNSPSPTSSGGGGVATLPLTDEAACRREGLPAGAVDEDPGARPRQPATAWPATPALPTGRSGATKPTSGPRRGSAATS